MKTYYFVSFDNGCMEFAVTTVKDYITVDVAQYMLTMEYPVMWIALPREEYMQLRNQ